jgi:hypothetical protein
MAGGDLQKSLDQALSQIMVIPAPLKSDWQPILGPIRDALIAAGVGSQQVNDVVEALHLTLRSMAPTGVVPRPYQTNVFHRLHSELRARRDRDPVLGQYVASLDQQHEERRRINEIRRNRNR